MLPFPHPFWELCTPPIIPKPSHVYILKGDPIAMARPRFGRGHVYDAQAALKLVLGIDLRNQHAHLPPYKGPLELQAKFFITIPARLGKKKRPLYQDQPALLKPDLDNFLKWVCDLGQQAGLYENDLQICRILSEKVYTADNPRTEFVLLEL